MTNMDGIPKTKGKKKSKVTKSKQEIVMENSIPNADQSTGNKKRKYIETEEEIVVQPLQKKSKRQHKKANLTADENDQNPNISSDINKETNIKKRKKKTEMNTCIDTIVGTEVVENKQNIDKKAITPGKIKKKVKNSILSVDGNSAVDENEISSDQIIPSTVKNKDHQIPKKSKKKIKQSDINNIVTENGDMCNNTDIVPESNGALNIIGSNSINNCHQKHEIDIEDKFFMDVITDVPPTSYANLNNNDTEIKREVNVIDIKNEGGEENREKVVTISIRDTEGVNTNENELLKQLERKLKPKIPKETINWPQADLKELLKRMEVCIPPNDNRPFLRCLEEIEWDNIIFKSYTIEECRNMWSKLQKKVRKYRILNEVLQDAKTWVENYTTKIKAKALNQTKLITIKKKGRPQKHPDMPRKPLTAYFIFYLENRDSYLAEHPGVDAAEVSKALAPVFQTLSSAEKKKYEEISLQKKAEYNKKLEEFYETHPEVPRVVKELKPKSVKSPKAIKEISSPKPVKEKGSPKPAKVPKPPKQKVPVRPHPPFHYFYISELEKENVDDRAKFREICKEKWKQLPERNKLVWIHYAEAEIAKYEEELEEYIRQHPDYVKNPLKPVLSKEDMQIKDRAAGKPIKPPGSAYNIFASKLLQSDEIKKVPVRDRLIFVSNQWKYCTDDEKNYYRELYIEARNKYKDEYNAYLETLPEDDRKEELKKMAPKMVKTESEKKVIKREPKKKKVTSAKMSKKTLSNPKEIEMQSEETEKLKEPQQPPISPFKYFCSIYSGDEPVAQAWKALSKQQKKVYEEELIQKKKDYIQDFEKFLKSLSEEELEAFSNSRRRAKEEKQGNEEEESDSFDSDESSEEENDEQDS